MFDQWGRDIVFDATGGQPYYGPSFSTKKYYPAMETKAAPKPGDVRTRPVGGAEILSSRHFPEAMQGNLIVLNTIGFQGVLNYSLTEDGAGLKSTEVESIVSSTDKNFRPVDAEVGPDGALYFVDWHNPIIGHMQHNLRDASRDKDHGRVYRVTYPERPLLTPVKIAGQPIPQLLDALKEPENRVRYRAKIELSARNTKDVLAALQTWVDRLDAKAPGYEHHMMEALWVYQWHNTVNEKLLTRMLRSSDPWARAAATRVLCYWRDRVTNPLGTAQDPGDRRAPGRAPRGSPRRELLPNPGGRRGRARVAGSTAGPLPEIHARPDDEHPQAVRPVRSVDARTASCRLGVLCAVLGAILAVAPGAAAQDAPRILLNQPIRAVEYQLDRLSNDELVLVERKGDDVRYRPVYMALLTRKGVAPQFRDESLAALSKMDKSSQSRVLLEALSRVPVDDALTTEKLLGLLLTQPVRHASQGTRGVHSDNRRDGRARRSCFVARTAPS